MDKNLNFGSITSDGFHHYYTTTTNGTTASFPYTAWNKEETLDEIFNKKKMIRTKDLELMELTYAEIYEIKKMKKLPEQLTRKEIEDILMILKI